MIMLSKLAFHDCELVLEGNYKLKTDHTHTE